MHGLFYAVMAYTLSLDKKFLGSGLIPAFSGLALAFFTLSIPLSYSSLTTASSWAIESLAILWFGVRQQDKLTRLSAALILLGSTGAFIINVLDLFWTGPTLEFYLSGFLVALANFSCAYVLFDIFRHTKNYELELVLAKVFFVVGCIIWYYINLNQIDYYYRSINEYIII